MTGRNLHRSALFLLGVWLCASNALHTGAQPVSFTGRLESTVFTQLGVPRRESAWRFLAHFDLANNIWRIDDLDNPGRYTACAEALLYEQTMSHDGLPNLRLSSFDDGFPLDIDVDHRMVWFAFAARDYIRSREGQLAFLPSAEPRLELKAHGCRIYAAWEEPTDSCAKYAEFQFDSKLFKESVQHMTLELPGKYVHERQQQYDTFLRLSTNGQLRATFNVTHWTNINSVRHPKEWTLTEYLGADPRRVYHGRLQEAEVLDQVELPAVPSTARVLDMRVRDVRIGVNSVTYSIADGKIPELGSELLASLTARAAAPDRRALPPDTRRARSIFLLTILVLVGVPFVVAVRAFWRSSRHGAVDK